MYMNKPILFHNKSLLLCASLIKNISYTEIHFTKKKTHPKQPAENFWKVKKQYMSMFANFLQLYRKKKNTHTVESFDSSSNL